jgi:hypothetical protein
MPASILEVGGTHLAAVETSDPGGVLYVCTAHGTCWS